MPDPSAVAPQIGFLKLTVADLEGARAFYEAAFAMTAGEPIVQANLTELVMKSPDNPFALTLMQYADGRPTNGGGGKGALPFYLGFYVNGMDEAVTRAQAAGAQLIRGPDLFGSVSFAFLKDPDGHVIELIDRGDG